MPPLSSKFGDIYPVTGYEENGVVTAAVNGLHSDMNGEGGNMALKGGVSLFLVYYLKKMSKINCEFPCWVSGMDICYK